MKDRILTGGDMKILGEVPGVSGVPDTCVTIVRKARIVEAAAIIYLNGCQSEDALQPDSRECSVCNIGEIGYELCYMLDTAKDTGSEERIQHSAFLEPEELEVVNNIGQLRDFPFSGGCFGSYPPGRHERFGRALEVFFNGCPSNGVREDCSHCSSDRLLKVPFCKVLNATIETND